MKNPPNGTWDGGMAREIYIYVCLFSFATGSLAYLD